MDELAEMRVFVHAIERGTFAGAASVMGLTPSAVSKLIGRLEERLGVRLVNRTTRKLALTAEGETYFHSGRRLIEAVDGLEHEIAASTGHPRGLLRINTAVSFGVQHLAPALIEFQQRYPDVRVSASLTDRPVDLHAEQIDVAVRVGAPSDSGLMSRKVGEVGQVICASPQYLAQFGVPTPNCSTYGGLAQMTRPISPSLRDIRPRSLGTHAHGDVDLLGVQIDRPVGQRHVDADVGVAPLEVDHRRRQVLHAERHRRADAQRPRGSPVEAAISCSRPSTASIRRRPKSK